MRKASCVLLVLLYSIQLATIQLSVDASAYVPVEASPSWATTGNYDSSDVALGDFDNDGDLDLASFGEDNVLLYRNQNGDMDTTAFWTSTDGTSGSSGSVLWADIDNDNYPELFTSLGMYENSNGVLGPTATFTNISSAGAFTVGDVIGDANLDLVLGWTDLIEVYENVGGVIDDSPDWNTTEQNSPKALALGDMDNDGRNELAVGNRFDPIRLYDNVGGSLKNLSTWNSTITDYVGCLAWGDIANDSFPDLFACTQPFIGGEPNRIYMNTGGALEGYPSWNSTLTSYATDARFVDMNGDGFVDLVASNSPYFGMSGLSLGQELVYLNTDGVMDEAHDWSGPYQDVSYGLDVGLVNGDLYPDVFVASREDLLMTYPGRVLAYMGLPPNRPPVIVGISYEPSIGTGEQETITVTNANDPDGDAITFDFSVTPGNGTILSVTGSSAVWKAPDVEGDCIVNITASDGKGGFGYYDVLITVLPNHPPQITGVTVNPQRPETGKDATIMVDATDSDGDALTFNFSVTPGNGTIVSVTGSSAVWKAPGSAGNCTINVTVSDGRGGFAYRDIAVVVVTPSPDDVPFFSLDNMLFLLMLVLIIIIVVVLIAVAIFRRRRKPVKMESPLPPQPDQPQTPGK